MTKQNVNFKLFTDGACSGNPGPGGWAYVVNIDDVSQFESSGGESDTTNNKMELSAVINGLKAINNYNQEINKKVTITTDSKYIVDAMNSGWLNNWIKNNWINSAKKPVANKEKWIELLKELEIIGFDNYEFKWVKGHNGQKENERCDQLATTEVSKIKNARVPKW